MELGARRWLPPLVQWECGESGRKGLFWAYSLPTLSLGLIHTHCSSSHLLKRISHLWFVFTPSLSFHSPRTSDLNLQSPTMASNLKPVKQNFNLCLLKDLKPLITEISQVFTKHKNWKVYIKQLLHFAIRFLIKIRFSPHSDFFFCPLQLLKTKSS